MVLDVSPEKQNIDTVFSNTVYFIDFYQRDYKWTEEPVKRLLEDLFYKFNLEYIDKNNLDPSKEVITKYYPWYYLNTYVTNTIEGKVFVVDGQQRLTTLMLILIKLYHMCEQFNSKLNGWIEKKIAGQSGFEVEFWMNHENYLNTQKELYEGNIDFKQINTTSGITAANMVENFKVISEFLDKELDTKHKFETFVFYLLYRIVLINLSVEQTDVPMVFEVINDRGVRLKPYEILKGKLLGQIDKVELKNEKYNELWEQQIKSVNRENDDEIDSFFRFYLKAKFSNTRKEGQKFDGDYHREIFQNNLNNQLNLKYNPAQVKNFLKNEFLYYTNLYRKIQNCIDKFNEDKQHVFYNYLNDLDGQFLLILSGSCLNENNEEEKIKSISYELDRLFTLLQLQHCYDSNAFQEIIYKISAEIRDKDTYTYRPVFDKYLLEELSDKRNIKVNNCLQYGFFRSTGINLNVRFKRYFFGRIEKFISDNLNLEMKTRLDDLVLKTGNVSGYHIEHILSFNKHNLNLFNKDEELFEQERNRLGGLLLLKGRDNISSGNESFKQKLKSYANTLYWNETLRTDFYKSKKDIDDFMKKYKLNFKPYSKFGQQELEERHRLLFNMIEIIWQ